MRQNHSCLLLVLCCFLSIEMIPATVTVYASPDFAHTPEEWAMLRDNTMAYEELPDLVHEYNPTVQNNRVEYQDFFDKDRDDISNEYFRKAAEAADAVRFPKDEDQGYAAKYADAKAAEAAIRGLRQQGLDNLDDGTIKGLTFEKKEAEIVRDVQKNMIAYNQYQLQLKQAQENRNYLEKFSRSIETKFQIGMVTESDRLQAKQNVLDVDTTIAQLERSIQDTRQGLCIATGWKYDAKPDIRSIPEVENSKIDNINPSMDKEQALAANYTLKINQYRLNNSQDSASTRELQIMINDNCQKINSDIDLAYNAVLQARVSYRQALAELNSESGNMQTAELKYQTGAFSELQYMEQKNTFVQKQINAQLKNIELFQALENYNWNVKGLGSSV